MSYVEPPAGWFTFGSHLDYRGLLEFSDEFDEGGYPRFERPSAKDPFPYVGEYGSRHAYPGTLNQKPLSFEPRPEYEQREEVYQNG